MNVGTGGFTGWDTGEVSDYGAGGLTPPSTTGIGIGDVGNVLSTANMVIDALGLGDFVGSTIGAVIANGFDLSCWGSTFTPKDATVWAQTDFPKIYSLTIGKGLTTESVQAFADILSWNYRQGIHFGNKMNSCSKKALHNYANASIKYRDEILNKLGSQIQILGDETTKRSYATLFVTAQKNFDTYDKDYVTKKVVATGKGGTGVPKDEVTQAGNTAILEGTQGSIPKTGSTYNASTGINGDGVFDESMGDLPKEPKTSEGGGFPWWLALIFFI